MKVGVVTFPGTLDDRDAARAVRFAGGQAISLWHGDEDLHGVDAVILPGGFSYGDYLISSGWDKKSPPPELPNEIVEKTAARYEQAYFRITGSRFNG